MTYFAQSLPIDYPEPPRSKKTRIWPAITPELHEQIKRLYREKSGCGGEVREFASRHNLPRWKITRYAIEQGWTSKQPKEPNWSEPELSILERCARHCPDVIQRKLKAAGYTRSVVGIVLKRKRLRLPHNLGGMSANQLSLCLGEDQHFVTRAIRLGQLKASRRQTERTPQQGGDIYFIREKHIREFILENLNAIDLRKVDKYWFVDLLTGGAIASLESEAV